MISSNPNLLNPKFPPLHIDLSRVAVIDPFTVIVSAFMVFEDIVFPRILVHMSLDDVLPLVDLIDAYTVENVMEIMQTPRLIYEQILTLARIPGAPLRRYDVDRRNDWVWLYLLVLDM